MAQRRTNGEGSVSYSKARNEYIASLRWNGKRHSFYSGKGGKKADAIRKMNQWKIEHMNDDRLPGKQELILENRMMVWLNTVKRPELKPSSFDRLESTIRCQIIPRIGGYKVTDITAAMIKEELLNAMQKDGLKVSSVKKAYDAMNAYLKYEAYHNMIRQNPMGLMKAPRADVIVHDGEDTAEAEAVNVLSPDEMMRLKEIAYSCWSTGRRRYPAGGAIMLILNTGLRMGEALALTWNDVDLEKKILHVSKNAVMIQNREEKGNKQKLVIQRTPKTKKSTRIVPLTNDAIDALKDMKAQQGAGETQGLVIANQYGQMVKPRNLLTTLHRMCDASGVHRIGLHALRHTFATRLFEKNQNVKVISELLGHGSTDITCRIYIHVIDCMKMEAVQTLNQPAPVKKKKRIYRLAS